MDHIYAVELLKKVNLPETMKTVYWVEEVLNGNMEYPYYKLDTMELYVAVMGWNYENEIEFRPNSTTVQRAAQVIYHLALKILTQHNMKAGV